MRKVKRQNPASPGTTYYVVTLFIATLVQEPNPSRIRMSTLPYSSPPFAKLCSIRICFRDVMTQHRYLYQEVRNRTNVAGRLPDSNISLTSSGSKTYSFHHEAVLVPHNTPARFLPLLLSLSAPLFRGHGQGRRRAGKQLAAGCSRSSDFD